MLRTHTITGAMLIVAITKRFCLLKYRNISILIAVLDSGGSMTGKLGIMTVLLWGLSGCSAITGSNNNAAQALSMAQTDNENLKDEESQLRQTLEAKQTELESLRTTTQ